MNNPLFSQYAERSDLRSSSFSQGIDESKLSLYSCFVRRFASATLDSLIDSFNQQVGSRAWSSARALHDQALIEELIKRGVDVSAIYDGHAISFARRVRLDSLRSKLLIANE